MTRAPLALRSAALGAVLVSCHAATPASAPEATPAAPEKEAAKDAPPRWLVLERSWIERTESGLDRVVLNGRRAELSGAEIARLGPAEPEVDGGARVPPWIGSARHRYVFWKGKQLFGAEAFDGPLTPIATLPAAPNGTFTWVDGPGVIFPGGALAIPAAGGAPKRLGVPTATFAAALDDKRGAITTALGHTWITLDGGASYRDASKELGGAAKLEVRGEAIVATLPGGRERLITAAGAITDAGPTGSHGRARDRAPPDEPDLFRDATGVLPRSAAAQDGLPLPDGGVVVSARGFVGRFDVAAQRTTSIAPLDPGLKNATCAPLQAGSAILLACVGPERAAVVDVTGAPRTERTFDLAGASDLDRFVAAEGGALGFLGPCDGIPRVPEVEIVSRGEPYNASRQRTPVFCARAGRDAWIEHRLDPEDARDVVAWIPRPGGGAAAIVLRYATFLDERERISSRGALRVVRLARSEPPLAVTPYAFDRNAPVSRSLRALADDTIVGWLPTAGYSSNIAAVRIDAGGHLTALHQPPRVSQLATSGRFALARGEDGRFWETVDTGEHWREIDPPPGARLSYGTHPSACSPAGCVLGSFVRLGWGAKKDAADPPPFFSPDAVPDQRRYYRRPDPTPAVRLACAPAAPPEGKRVPDSAGFGYTPQPAPRNGWLMRIGSLGFATRPSSNGMQLPSSGDFELAWLAPLDTTAKVRRATLSISRLGLGGATPRSSELRVGYLLTPEGELESFAIGLREGCLGRVLDAAGITRPLGDCAEDRSVGVDLGGRVILVSPRADEVTVSAAEAPPARGKSRGARAIPAALRALATNEVGATLWMSFGVGSRRGAPVVVAVDANGGAALAPLDPERGTIGAEEHLRPLGEAMLGSHASCAPRDGEAKVVLPFEGLIGLDRGALRGVAPTSNPGVAVLRWSRDRACLDAVEIAVRDDRFDENPGPYDPHGSLRKLVARFDKRAAATLALIGTGTEMRQKLACTALLPGSGEAP